VAELGNNNAMLLPTATPANGQHGHSVARFPSHTSHVLQSIFLHPRTCVMKRQSRKAALSEREVKKRREESTRPRAIAGVVNKPIGWRPQVGRALRSKRNTFVRSSGAECVKNPAH